MLSVEEVNLIKAVPTQNMGALEAYFLGKAKRFEGGVSGLQEAIVFFKRAVELDPEYAEAHALLGRTLLEVTWSASLHREAQMAKAEPHIFKALQLNDLLSDAHLSLGLLRAWQGDLAAEEQAYQRALELNPRQADVLVMLAGVVSQPDEKEQLLKQAYAVDPGHPDAPFRLANAMRASGKFEECRNHLEDFAARNPDNPKVYASLNGLFFRELGLYDECIIVMRKFIDLEPGAIGNRAYISSSFDLLGDLKSGRWWYEGRMKYVTEGEG